MYCIRQATIDDIAKIAEISHQYRSELGYVNPAALREHISKGNVHVCTLDEFGVIGFVDFHARLDGWQTIYHLATGKDHRGAGVGRQLLYSVPCPMRLKVTVDNGLANQFYTGAGMSLAGTEAGKKRALNIYELKILGIFCMGSGQGDTFPTVARKSGMAYGVRSSEKARAWPFMLDIDWKKITSGKFTWAEYMKLVNEYRPIQAMCVDYESPEQLPQLNRQIAALRAAGIMRIMVCPKFDGAVSDIPDDCIVAISIPSDYAGFIPNYDELLGRKIHLLGGTPQKQRKYTLEIQAAGATVISFDGNSHQRAAKLGCIYADGVWQRTTRLGKYGAEESVAAMINSGRNWMNMMQQVSGVQQLPLPI